jgi:hypothetical protein
MSDSPGSERTACQERMRSESSEPLAGQGREWSASHCQDEGALLDLGQERGGIAGAPASFTVLRVSVPRSASVWKPSFAVDAAGLAPIAAAGGHGTFAGGEHQGKAAVPQ